jgi:pilus assembly protein CpaE
MASEAPVPTIALIGPDAGPLNAVASALAQMSSVRGLVIPQPVEQAGRRPELAEAAAIVVDLDTKRRESLLALQAMIVGQKAAIPVIVLTGGFDDALARWFLQIRVADFLRKPVEPRDVLQACIRALRATSDLPGAGGQIIALLPAAGGVGTTTLAIETAMLLREGARSPESTCLVDLDFQSGPCADYLDLEPRLDLDEIATRPERLDLQLLEVLLSRHGSGLQLLAARGRPAQRPQIPAEVALRLLDLVSQRFENVVLDMPRAWEAWTDEVLMAANRVFVVTDMTVPGLRLGRRVAAAVAERLEEVKPRVIVNRFEQQHLFGTGLRRSEVERALEGLMAGTVSNNYKLVREAIDRGVTLETVKAGSNVSADLRRIVLAQAAE